MPPSYSLSYTITSAVLSTVAEIAGEAGPALVAGLIEYTIPEKPKSRLQKYRLAAEGRDIVKSS